MSTFTLLIDIDNDAFADEPERELARLLRVVANRAEEEPESLGFFQTVFDANGNDVGRFAIKEGVAVNAGATWQRGGRS